MKTKLLLFLLIFTVIKMNAQQEIYSFGNYASDFIKFKDNFLFQGYKEDSGREIWQSNGTTQNTKLLKDINPSTSSNFLPSLQKGSAILNNELYFIINDDAYTGVEIWKTDGTEAGTVKVSNFIKGKISKLTAVGNYLFFLAKNDDTFQVWKTDGTANGMVLIKEILNQWNSATFEGKCNNTFIFTIQPAVTNDSRVWRSDGTADGTFPITGQIDGNGSDPGGTTGLTQYIEHNNKLYFMSRYFLYETDGTLENTKPVATLTTAQNTLVDYSDVTSLNDDLYFMFFSTSVNQLTVWKFDTTIKKETLLYINSSQYYFSPSNFEKMPNALLFTTSNPTGGTSLVSLDVTNNKVSYLKELSNGLTAPTMFIKYYDYSPISKISDGKYFISSVENNYMKKGWIADLTLNTTENISILDNVVNTISYKDELYYAKDNKLYKYANNLDIPSIGSKKALIIYPNPSSDFVQINTPDDDRIESAAIYDINGKLVINTIDLNNGKIDVSKLTKGNYFMQIKINGTFIEKKIIKE